MPDPIQWLVCHACQSAFALEPKKKRRDRAKRGDAEHICYDSRVLCKPTSHKAFPAQTNAVKSLKPQFCMCNHKRHGPERRIVEVQWSSGIPFWMQTAHRYESMFDSCCRVVFEVNKRPKSRWDSGNRSSEGLQQATFSKVMSLGWSCQWVNAGSTRSARSIPNPTSKTWIYLTYWLTILKYFAFCPYISHITAWFQWTSSHCLVACLQPQHKAAFLRRIRHRQKRDTMRVSFVDVPLQNLESVWIGLDSGHYAKRVVLEVSYCTARWMDTCW